MAEEDIKTKHVEPMSVVCKSFQGPYDQTEDVLDELMGWIMRVGHPFCAPPRAVYYDDPEEVPEDELRAEVCLPVAERVMGDDEVENKQLPETEVAYIMHEGPYDGIPAVYEELFSWIEENDYTFREGLGTREVFHKLYGEVETEEQLVTEVQVPIEKAGEVDASDSE